MPPETWTLPLSIATALAAVTCIVCDERRLRRGVYFAKPATTLCVIAIALLAGDATPAFEQQLVVAGLVFSLAGDIFLMLPRDRFIAGLSSFLVAHVLYILAFSQGLSAPNFAAALPFVVLAGAYYALLWPQLGPLKLPVAVYVAAIAVMAWFAAARWIEHTSLLPGLACAGACLFVVSDAALAWNRFRGGFRGAQTVVLSTYFSAQWLIALSLGAGLTLFGGFGR